MVTGLVSELGVNPDERGNLMLVPRTAEDFRAMVSALRSIDGSKGVSFHTFSLPEDRCVRLLVKNICRHDLKRPGGV